MMKRSEGKALDLPVDPHSNSLSGGLELWVVIEKIDRISQIFSVEWQGSALKVWNLDKTKIKPLKRAQGSAAAAPSRHKEPHLGVCWACIRRRKLRVRSRIHGRHYIHVLRA